MFIKYELDYKILSFTWVVGLIKIEQHSILNFITDLPNEKLLWSYSTQVSKTVAKE